MIFFYKKYYKTKCKMLAYSLALQNQNRIHILKGYVISPSKEVKNTNILKRPKQSKISWNIFKNLLNRS